MYKTELQNLEFAQLKLTNEWVKNKFVKDVFVVPAAESCQLQNPDAEPLFYYTWQGLMPYYKKETDDGFIYTLSSETPRHK